MGVVDLTNTVQNTEQEIADIYYRLPKFKDRNLSITQRRAINRRLVAVYATIGKDRETLIQKSLNEMHSSVDSQWKKWLVQMGKPPCSNALITHLLNLYFAAKTDSTSDAEVQRIIGEQLRTNPFHRQKLESILSEGLSLSGADFSAGVDIFHAMQVLFHWYAARAFSTAINAPKKYLTWWAIRKVSGLAFSVKDWLFIDILMGTQYKELLAPIIARQNLITVPGFTNSMFDSIRDTFERELYQRAGGALGAEALSRRVLDNLTAAHGGNLPTIPDHKYMLWARTEGVVIQTDALMTLGKRAEMDGKIWQTVGDGAVRENHAVNELDGVIPEYKAFSDGSMDAGTGSVEPYNCRCVCGPALLEQLSPNYFDR